MEVDFEHLSWALCCKSQNCTTWNFKIQPTEYFMKPKKAFLIFSNFKMEIDLLNGWLIINNSYIKI